MSAIKPKGTKLETAVAKSLWAKGIRFRRNVSNLMGCPDIAIKKYRVVVFIDSCFWHLCERHCIIPRNNAVAWKHKLEDNRRRDEEVNAYYKEHGWHIMRVWEHDLHQNFDAMIESIVAFISEAKAAAMLPASGNSVETAR